MENHNWTETEVPLNLRDSFGKRFVCINGDCKCEKLVSKLDSRIKIYDRLGQISSTMLECYGKVPLNEQGIDD